MEKKDKVLQASAQIYTPNKGTESSLPPLAHSNDEIVNYYYVSPEVNNIGRSTARTISRVLFNPILKEGNKKLKGIDGKYIVDEQLAKAAEQSLSRIKGPIGGSSQIYGAIAQALAVTGDTWLLGYQGDPSTAEPSTKDSAEEMWVTLPRKQLSLKQNGANGTYLEVKFDKKDKDPYKILSGYKLIRLWIPRFDNPMAADSWVTPIRSTIDRLEYAQQALSASALSQLNAGIIVVPSDQDPAPAMGEHTNETEDDGTKEKSTFPEQLSEQLEQYVVDANENLDGGGRTTPAVIGIDSEVRMPEWIEITRAIDTGLMAHIEQLRQTIATASPFPSEQLQGNNQAKFYQGVHNVQRLDQETFRYVYEPLCEIIADCLTRFILHEDLSENFDPQDYEQIIVGWDTSKIVSPADKCEKAMKLMDYQAITIAELREACGWDVNEDVAQTDVAQETILKASANPQKDTVSLAEIAAIYQTQLGLICDQTITRMKERAGARLLSVTNKKQYEHHRETFNTVEISQIGQLDGVEEFAQTVGETNDTLFIGALSGLEKQYRKLTQATIKKVNKALQEQYDALIGDQNLIDLNVNNGWEYLSNALIDQARKDFFNKKINELPGQPVLYAIPAIILRQTSAIVGGASQEQASLASISTGPYVLSKLSSVGLVLSGYEWVYGDPATRKTPYELHLNEDGKLSNIDLSDFNGQYPSDHVFCQCYLEPKFEKGN